MIQIDIYNNGIEIKGHARPDICAEVSVLAFVIANELFYEGISARYYTSMMKHINKVGEGLTWIILDKNCEKSMRQLELYKYNLERWKHNWVGHVSINNISEDLSR